MTKPMRPLGGPWLIIARRVMAGATDVKSLKLCAANAFEASKVTSNVRTMVRLGFLYDDGGRLSLTSRCKDAMAKEAGHD